MDNKDLIKQYVDTGLELPEHQVTQLPNWAIKTYVRKRLMADFLNGYEFLLLNQEEADKYLNRLSDWQFRVLLNTTSQPEKIIPMLGEKGNEIISRLNYHQIITLLSGSYEPEFLFNMLGDKGKTLIPYGVKDNDVYVLLHDSPVPEKIINILGEKGERAIDRLDSDIDSDIINMLLDTSKNPNKVKELLVKFNKI